jgi:peptidoglycan glycosyltransferase
MSPLHAAMITSSIANNGDMMEPWIINNIRDGSDRILYSARPRNLANPIRSETAQQMKLLMEDTVRNGTCRRTFRSLLRKKDFQDFELGAKTGTINDQFDRYKYDWLTAYALPGNGSSGHGICVVVLAVHGSKLGIRSKDIAKKIISYHFAS